MARIKVKIGDVFQIPLPDGGFAYGRVYDDASVGIYSRVSDQPLQPPIGSRSFLFIVGLYSDILENGQWRIIGHDAFGADESTWPPPYFVRDVISGEYQIYHKGLLTPAESHEVVGLEEAAVYDANHIIDRILKEISEDRNTSPHLN
ncbi:MAG TPA: immunity 26/phosphotriesterase HocA family protein [Pyrinomonadaceae bacterium]|jgi:hypothetical protein|nr:immunity 26/phosphotriesterase HocA family protein [Pyrinomonadaceae bacterium]